MLSNPFFEDRADAGEKLAEAVENELGKFNLTAPDAVKPIVYALPRGGLPVAVPVARRLGCPLDVVVAKKITRPDNLELAIGAATADGHVLWQKQKQPNLHWQKSALQQAENSAQSLLGDLASGRPNVSAAGALVILVDDGIATGMTVAVAAVALQSQQPAAVWICAPVAPDDLMGFLAEIGDKSIILETPNPFYSVSRFYAQFPQVETAEALECLQRQIEWRL
ncbi:phosphoribosyltransferase [Microcoleus sp. LEGE 07076]|uniref:phosphoribosyltransferase n=1 Tax=Microcoleus sp. LEGE 07076 TaxID=915322 RepID=UPI00188038AD|nr:phosphoribosyltransferase family protein [Microcoleus sp. LEGE 07076]MBE9185664.1 phosphoribosyltransferase [Microcoleus sp. LEGE 07076]